MNNRSGATLVQDLIARVAHLYPLYSGCGRIASHQFFKRITGDKQRLVWARTGSGSIKVPLTDFVGKTLFFFGDLDPKLTWIVRRLVQPGQTVADIGANVGIMTLLLSKLVGVSGKVHAFEPNPYLSDLLQETLRRNAVLNTILYEMGLGSTTGEMELSVPKGNLGMGSLIRASLGDNDQIYRVPINTLDQVCNKNCDRLDLIKIDVEGFEHQVFEGGRSTFSRFRPVVVLEENQLRNKCDLPGSISFLLERDYRFVGIPKNLLRMKLYLISDADVGKDPSHDFVAIPKEKLLSLAPRLNIFSGMDHRNPTQPNCD